MLRTDLIVPIAELVHRHATERGDKVAFRDASSAVTYGALARRSGHLAGHLAEQGLAPGDRVAILLPNSVAWVESCIAVARAGGIGVPISVEASDAEIAYRLTDAACRIVVTTGAHAARIRTLQAEAPDVATRVVVVGGGDRDALRYEDLAERPPATAPRDPTDIDQPAFIIYTSGTTGRAKGVLLSVRSMLWVVAACWSPIAGLSERDRVLSALPLYHSYALNLTVLGVLAVGASEHIMEKYSTGEAIRLLRSGDFTLFPGVPTMFHYLLQAAQAEPDFSLDGLRLCLSAGAILPASLNREFEARFRVPLLDGYGITETATMVTMNWPIGGRVPGSCGLPLPGLAVRIVDPGGGTDVAPGGEGELIVHGPNLMAGYHNKPEETAKALRVGWYHTGDLARADANGFLTITGRLKELIIRGGQNIAPAEIEEVVCAVDGVIDCAVVGLPHPQLGEVPALFVVRDADRDADRVERGGRVEADGLLAHCRSALSAYKVPHSVHFVAEIPRTGSGKIIRFKLREMVGA